MDGVIKQIEIEGKPGIALFDAFASREKTMHINPGGHTSIPEFERESYERFFLRTSAAGRARAPNLGRGS
jgi:hypothetical protein